MKRYFFVWFALVEALNAQTVWQEGSSYFVCNKEIQVHELWIHQQKPMISMSIEGINDTISLSIGEKIPYIECDLYIQNIDKLFKNLGKIYLSSNPKEISSINLVNSLNLQEKRYYQINGKVVYYERTPNHNSFMFGTHDSIQQQFKLMDILWLGSNAFVLKRFEREKLYLIRLTELIFVPNDTLFQLANEDLPHGGNILQIVYLPAEKVKHNNKNYRKDELLICLVKVYLDDISFDIDKDRFIIQGKEKILPFSVIKIFSNKQEAYRFANENKITDIFLE